MEKKTNVTESNFLKKIVTLGFQISKILRNLYFWKFEMILSFSMNNFIGRKQKVIFCTAECKPIWGWAYIKKDEIDIIEIQ